MHLDRGLQDIPFGQFFKVGLARKLSSCLASSFQKAFCIGTKREAKVSGLSEVMEKQTMPLITDRILVLSMSPK